MTDIVVDKNKLDELIEKVKPTLNRCHYDIFYLDETIPFKHLSTGEVGTITNLPFYYDGYGYFIIYSVYNSKGEEEKFIDHITHVNISSNVGYKDITVDGVRYTFYCHHFCNSLNHTYPDKHFGNEGLIKATLSYNIRQQNPSDAYLRADQWLKLFTRERALTCNHCHQAIKPDANPIERVLGTHLSCRPNLIHSLVLGNYFYQGSNYTRTYGNLPDDTNKVYKNITREQLQEALNNLVIDVDYTMVGCGSAGSNIAYQLSKTSLLNKGVLYDNDYIELKNLRNTVYSSDICGRSKSRELSNIMTRSNEEYNLKQQVVVQGKYNPETDIYNGKYVFNVVDSLVTRLQVAESAKYRYIIDTRFKGLNCGVYIIDKENEQEYKYYLDGLKQSIKDYIENVRVEKEKITPNIAHQFRWVRNEWECASKLRKRPEKFYRELPLDQKEALLRLLDESRRTCNSPNIVDIYTIMAGIVVSAIRNIESGKDKPFTHLELSTENGMLQQMVVAK